jgi:hypothetical protein
MTSYDNADKFMNVLHQARAAASTAEEEFASHTQRTVRDVIGAVVVPDGSHPTPGSGDAAALVTQFYGSTSETSNLVDDLPAVSSATIEKELALHPAMSAEELRAIRRDYALRNHPDRVPERLRALSTLKMTLANAIIDAAITRRNLLPG